MYVERYSKDPSTYEQDTAEGLKGLIEVALEFTKLPQFLGRSEPTVITVSITRPSSPFFFLLLFILK